MDSCRPRADRVGARMEWKKGAARCVPEWVEMRIVSLSVRGEWGERLGGERERWAGRWGMW